MNTDLGSYLKKDSVNINTIIALVGFLSMFAGFVATWTLLQVRQNETQTWINSHEDLHKSLAEQRANTIGLYDARLNAMQVQINKMDQYEYRLAQTEKVGETIDARINRVTESYAIQFSDIRAQLGTITVQLALANDALKRVETSRARQP